MAKHFNTVFWLIIWIILFAYLQIVYKFHFFYMEQSHLFLFDASYIKDNLLCVGGFSYLVAGFLNQFFIYPFVGAAITTTILVMAGMLTRNILKRIAPQAELPVFYLLPATFLMFIHFHFNYYLQGSISFLLCLLFLYIYLLLSSLNKKLIYLLISIPFLFWLAGSVSLLLAFGVLLKEVFTSLRKSFWFLIPAVEAIFLAVLSVRTGWVGEYRYAMLPDMYFNHLLRPDSSVIYLSWISLLIGIMIAGLINKWKGWKGKTLMISTAAQLIIIVLIVGYRHSKYIAQDTLKFKQIEYYNRTSQWDEILRINEGPVNNYMYACYLNMALAQKGELAERMFEYQQPGAEGLFVEWNRTYPISRLLSDIYFAVGCIAISQEKGFEANFGSPDGNCSYMLQRLIQTNIIFGEYAVAEKYIDILAKTLYYREWAEEHRKFLYNDDVVNADELLGDKRKCLPKEDYFYQSKGILGMLANSAEANPQDKNAIEYMGAAYLLHHSLKDFGDMLDTYYGTPVLPTLPKHFQEAAIVIYEKDRDIWLQKGITPETIERFSQYEQYIRSNQKKPNVAEGVKRFFGNTYWYYYMFK